MYIFFFGIFFYSVWIHMFVFFIIGFIWIFPGDNPLDLEAGAFDASLLFSNAIPGEEIPPFLFNSLQFHFFSSCIQTNEFIWCKRQRGWFCFRRLVWTMNHEPSDHEPSDCPSDDDHPASPSESEPSDAPSETNAPLETEAPNDFAMQFPDRPTGIQLSFGPGATISILFVAYCPVFNFNFILILSF